MRPSTSTLLGAALTVGGLASAAHIRRSTSTNTQPVAADQGQKCGLSNSTTNPPVQMTRICSRNHAPSLTHECCGKSNCALGFKGKELSPDLSVPAGWNPNIDKNSQEYCDCWCWWDNMFGEAPGSAEDVQIAQMNGSAPMSTNDNLDGGLGDTDPTDLGASTNLTAASGGAAPPPASSFSGTVSAADLPAATPFGGSTGDTSDKFNPDQQSQDNTDFGDQSGQTTQNPDTSSPNGDSGDTLDSFDQSQQGQDNAGFGDQSGSATQNPDTTSTDGDSGDTQDSFDSSQLGGGSTGSQGQSGSTSQNPDTASTDGDTGDNQDSFDPSQLDGDSTGSQGLSGSTSRQGQGALGNGGNVGGTTGQSGTTNPQNNLGWGSQNFGNAGD